MAKKNFNEVLKKQEAERKLHEEKKDDGHIALDSTERVKVLSPGRLVFNRFIRNKLAIIGSITLIVMFLFSFIAPVFYPYSQTQIFYKYDKVHTDYAQAQQRKDYTIMPITDDEIHYSVKNKLTAYINEMEKADETSRVVADDEGNSYVIQKDADHIYSLYLDTREEVCSKSGYAPFATYFKFTQKLTYTGAETVDEGFIAAVDQAIDSKQTEFTYGENDYKLTASGKKGSYSIDRKANTVNYVGEPLGADFEQAIESNLEAGRFTYGGETYTISSNDTGFTVYSVGDQVKAAYLTTYVFDAYDDPSMLTEEFKMAAIDATTTNGEFQVAGKDYVLEQEKDEISVFEKGKKDHPAVAFSNVAVRANDGSDTLDLEFKEKVRKVISEMEKDKVTKTSFDWEIPQLDKDGEYSVDEDGNVITETTPVNIQNKNGLYTMNCDMVTYLIDLYAHPTLAHPFGTDGDGMDVLARMMYGGRVSLLVCFVVIIIQMILGVIMGGIAGFFGGWIDNLIMRLVDVFYCIPSMPILIIVGAVLDAMKMSPYVRLVWMMFILGVLGWAGVARLVRGQILSLREQEFMVAAEAIGLNTRRRIFKHLVPNVLPQLIVTASNGLGSIIITESTLSFLGIGVKHPLATWGTMINSVTRSAETMKAYAYIWVPVGCLICLTVIAFNFVGDGLRDAFDPKMKR